MVKSVGDRLPVFTEQQQRRIKGSHDFYGTKPQKPCIYLLIAFFFFIFLLFSYVSSSFVFFAQFTINAVLLLGLNHYTTKWAVAAPFPAPGTSSGWIEDQGNVISNTDADGNLIGPQAESGW